MIRRWKFWASAALVSLPFLSMLLGNLFGLGAGIAFWGALIGGLLIAYLVWRSLVRRLNMPASGLEWVFLAGLAALGLSLLFSPDARMGWEQAAWSVGYGMLFLLLVDLFEAGASRTGVVYGLLFATGVVAAFAVLETYGWYAAFWQQSGSMLDMPPYPYRLISLLGHANSYMAFVNLAAPLALVIFLTSPRLVVRFATGLWFMFYLISVPFTSSRGGWLGMAGWMGVLALFWLSQGGRWRRWLAWLGRLRPWSYIATGLVVFIGFAAVVQIYLVFAAHPSHGSNLFGGRSDLWNSALQIWRSSPVTGVGVGRYPYEYLRVTPDFPPGFWSPHAHNLYLTVLAEQGLVGLVAFLALVGWGGYRLFRWQQNSPTRLQPWTVAMFAGIASWLVHSIFDDFTITLPVMILVVALAALVRAGVHPRPPRPARVPLAVLLVPLLGTVAVGVWFGWSGAPFDAALKAAPGPGGAGWRPVAELTGESARHDPFFAFYQAEAGLAWGQVWGESGDPADLNRARAYLSRSIEIEPTLSLIWANAAVLDWQAGEQEVAVDRMRRAIALAPREPSYPLNLGLFLESLHRPEEAAQAYRQALELEAAWATHPFWKGSPLRRQVSGDVEQEYLRSLAENPPHWLQARAALEAGRLEDARAALALARAVGEDGVAVMVVQAGIDNAEGNIQGSQQVYRELVDMLESATLQNRPYLASIYASTNRRKGLEIEIVPGYLKIKPDYGQLDALAALYQQQVSAGACEAAEETWLAARRASAVESRAQETYPGCGAPLP